MDSTDSHRAHRVHRRHREGSPESHHSHRRHRGSSIDSHLSHSARHHSSRRSSYSGSQGEQHRSGHGGAKRYGRHGSDTPPFSSCGPITSVDLESKVDVRSAGPCIDRSSLPSDGCDNGHYGRQPAHDRHCHRGGSGCRGPSASANAADILHDVHSHHRRSRRDDAHSNRRSSSHNGHDRHRRHAPDKDSSSSHGRTTSGDVKELKPKTYHHRDVCDPCSSTGGRRGSEDQPHESDAPPFSSCGPIASVHSEDMRRPPADQDWEVLRCTGSCGSSTCGSLRQCHRGSDVLAARSRVASTSVEADNSRHEMHSHHRDRKGGDARSSRSSHDRHRRRSNGGADGRDSSSCVHTTSGESKQSSSTGGGRGSLHHHHGHSGHDSDSHEVDADAPHDADSRANWPHASDDRNDGSRRNSRREHHRHHHHRPDDRASSSRGSRGAVRDHHCSSRDGDAAFDLEQSPRGQTATKANGDRWSVPPQATMGVGQGRPPPRTAVS
eukprot:gnl/TRDRNA2_/TRDRNA2_159459_c0_seq2.p1 gnl/TRDRNA2_/TRDRNA2_159459_c0~~gnl/TRDRNA2_/TRDRNA2_159459_c0_seq2.p1  ORF type:complete len:517 (-),score=24.41 gnl/TRDRNA2_/TRDRNA2_159459_c0_seq2:65-1549(-)